MRRLTRCVRNWPHMPKNRPILALFASTAGEAVDFCMATVLRACFFPHQTAHGGRGDRPTIPIANLASSIVPTPGFQSWFGWHLSEQVGRKRYGCSSFRRLRRPRPYFMPVPGPDPPFVTPALEKAPGVGSPVTFGPPIPASGSCHFHPARHLANSRTSFDNR